MKLQDALNPWPTAAGNDQSIAGLGSNVEDRRNRHHPGDFNQRIAIRAAMAEDELRNGIPDGSSYTRQDVINWLDKNSPLPTDETYGQAVGRSLADPRQSPMPGHYQDVQPMPDISAGMYLNAPVPGRRSR